MAPPLVQCVENKGNELGPLWARQTLPTLDPEAGGVIDRWAIRSGGRQFASRAKSPGGNGTLARRRFDRRDLKTQPILLLGSEKSAATYERPPHGPRRETIAPAISRPPNHPQCASAEVWDRRSGSTKIMPVGAELALTLIKMERGIRSK